MFCTVGPSLLFDSWTSCRGNSSVDADIVTDTETVSENVCAQNIAMHFQLSVHLIDVNRAHSQFILSLSTNTHSKLNNYQNTNIEWNEEKSLSRHKCRVQRNPHLRGVSAEFLVESTCSTLENILLH